MKELMALPNCDRHGQMTLRDVKQQTPEQKWCGTWYDCPICSSSALYPGPELSQEYYSRRDNWTVDMLERTLVCHTVLQPDEWGNFDRLWRAKLACEKTMGCVMRPVREG